MSWKRNLSPENFISAADRESIRSAAEAAEMGTSGEVVPYVVGRSDDYPGAPWKAAAWGGLLAALIAGLVHTLGGFWGGSIALWGTLPVTLASLAGFLAAERSAALRRWLVSPRVMSRRVTGRAEAAFLEEEVFNTRERTGILIFLSIFEHGVVILGDEGINSRVEQREWDGLVAALTAGIRAGKPIEALERAIHDCGELLASRRVERRHDDSDELDNALRTSDE